MNMRHLYEAAAEDVTFALGLMPIGEGEPFPYVHLFYQGWSRELLEVVRESFGSGLRLRTAEGAPGRIDLFIATREQVEIHGLRGAETSILRAAAWDAQLHGVEPDAIRLFEAERLRRGRWLLLMQTPEWEFLTGVSSADSVQVGEVVARTFPMPSGQQDS